ncbi:DUF5958 family protein [Streptomyces sp. NPDC048254]|uniref:DUF5958 family protein n=1 Tax=Streptomyces sp. NPDC048254 TaxID=3365525 RepID=UPI0037183DCD
MEAGRHDVGHQAAFLVQFCAQARATEADVPEAIARSGIRPTYTPAVMLTRSRLNMARTSLVRPSDGVSMAQLGCSPGCRTGHFLISLGSGQCQSGTTPRCRRPCAAV